MRKPIFHLLLAALLLCLLLPACVMADEEPAQVIIAIDSGNNRSMLPLAGVFAYRAEQSGMAVSIVDLFDPAEPAVYPAESGTSIADALAGYSGAKIVDEKKMAHMCDFLEEFFTETTFSAAQTDVYILSGYERELMVCGKWDEDKSNFTLKALKNAYTAVQNAMEANAQLRLHFYYGSSKADEKDKLDERLKALYGDRVNISVMPDVAADSTVMTQALVGPYASCAQMACEGVPVDGAIPYASTGMKTWLRLEFDPAAAPYSVSFSPDAPEALPVPAFCDALGRFWLLLPEGMQNGSIMLADEMGEACDAPYTLTVTTELSSGSLTLTGDGDQLYTPGQTLALSDNPTPITLVISHPGFAQADLIPHLAYAISEEGAAGESIYPLTLTADETQANTWHAELPALGSGVCGELRAEYTLWDRTLSNQVYPFAVGNRAPMLRDGIEQPIRLTAYYDIPAMGSSAMHFDLGQYFTDPDVNDIRTGSLSQTGNAAFECSASGSVMSYTALAASQPVEITASVSDGNGAVMECTLSVEHQSVKTLVDALYMAFPEDLDIPINESRQYDLVLPAGSLSEVSSAFAALNLPPLPDALRIYVNDEEQPLTTAEDGSLVLSIPVAASEREKDTTAAVRAELALLPDAAPVALEKLFPAPQFTISFINNPPRLADGVTEHQTAKADISGFPGSYHAVPFSDCFTGIVPANLFVNDENEALAYVLTIPKDLVSVKGLPEPMVAPEDSSRAVYQFGGELAVLPLEIDFLVPGEAVIELTVVDTSGYSPAQPIRFAATLNSVFTRIVIITVIVLLLLAAGAIAVVLILKHMRPSLEGVYAEISCLRTQSEDKWSDPRMYTSIPLTSYGKEPVSLLTLLTASGQMPPRDCEASLLTRIVFSPEKDGGFRVSLRGADAQNAVRLAVDGSSSDEAHVKFAGGQELTLRFMESSANEMLIVRMYRN